MTFEPTEIEELPLPITGEINVDFNEVDRLMRAKKIDEVLDITDRAILIDQYGFSQNEVASLRSIWRKLSNRRINRKKK